MSGRKAFLYLRPKPYEEVGVEFIIYGWVSVEWITTKFGNRVYSIFLDHLDMDGKVFQGDTIAIYPPRLFPKFRKRFWFAHRVGYDRLVAGWIASSHGLMTLRLLGNRDNQIVYIPVVVRGPWSTDVNQGLLMQHKGIEQRVRRLEDERTLYHQELRELFEKREEDTREDYSVAVQYALGDDQLQDDLFAAIEALEDEEVSRLEENYKDVIEWEGPQFGGQVGRVNNFVLTAYSNDHGRHFHVIHRGRGINARFSFPEIELLSYAKGSNSIGRNEIRAIQKFFEDATNCERIKKELDKRN